ncbi:hypothetical protein WMF30_36945 [Sorangium sp. So ce134]
MPYTQLLRTYPLSNNGFKIPDFIGVVKQYRMSTTWLEYDEFTTTRIDELVTKRGPLYVSFYLMPGMHGDWWHNVVVYDVDKGNGVYRIMNPETGLDSFSKRDFFRYGRTTRVLVGFKSVQGAGRDY